MDFYVLFVILFIAGFIFSTSDASKPCSIASLEDFNILSCDHQKDVTLPPKGGEVFIAHASTCLASREGQEMYFTCDNGNWMQHYEGEDSSLLLNRFKHVGGESTSRARRVRRAPSLLCPSDIVKPARPATTHRDVDWDVPLFYNGKEMARAELTSSRGPGYTFPEGKSKVTYMAVDLRSKETSYCTFTVTVKVDRCISLNTMNNGYFYCDSNTEFLYLHSCRFGCYKGYYLDGADTIRCQKGGHWSPRQPVCKPIVCPRLLPLGTDTAAPTCTNGENYGSYCTYTCGKGYDMPPNVSKVLVCSDDRQWRKSGEPRCIDIEPPRFDVCPRPEVHGVLGDKKLNTKSLSKPIATDNSGRPYLENPDVVRSQTELSVGTHRLKYGAKDQQNNRAKPCETLVIVREVRCPVVYPLPWQQVKCDGDIPGSICTLSCDEGYMLEKETLTKHGTCRQDKNSDLTAQWTWPDGYQPKCIVSAQCMESILAPKHAKVEYANTSFGRLAQVVYKCPKGKTAKSLHTKFRCLRGKWTPEPKLPGCQDTMIPKMQKRTKLKLLAKDNCKKLKLKFDNLIMERGLKQMKFSCTPQKIKKRPTREIDDYDVQSFYDLRNHPDVLNDLPTVDDTEYYPDFYEDVIEKSNSTVNQTNDEQEYALLEFTFDISIPFATEGEHLAAMIQRLAEFDAEISAFVAENLTALIEGFNASLLNRTEDEFEYSCEPGYVFSTVTMSCFQCSEGSFYDNKTRECRDCAQGTYQDLQGAESCKPCPIGTHTRHNGSSSMTNCIPVCGPGTFSRDGLVPCAKCQFGTYQPDTSQTACLACSASQTTKNVGATQLNECTEFDIQLIEGLDKSITVDLPEEVFLDDSIITMWVQTADLQATGLPLVSFGDNNLTPRWTSPTSENLSLQNITLEEGRQWHSVEIRRADRYTTVTIDGQLPVYNQTALHQPVKASKIAVSAGPDFKGTLSQLNVWSLGNNVSEMVSSCQSNSSGDLVTWGMFGAAVVLGGYIDVPTACDDENNCLSEPCQNNGSCIDRMKDFLCVCPSGFSGVTCGENNDDCGGHVCSNGATCVDGVNAYTCLCAPGFTGEFCELRIVDGSWSKWTEWSTCTTDCGSGNHTRWRRCNKPAPSNGGAVCQGPHNVTEDCGNDICPVCIALETPMNGSITCQNQTNHEEVEGNGLHRCTMSCDAGFEFDIEPPSVLLCGKETGYKWNLQAYGNPDGRVPSCMAVRIPDRVTFVFQAYYLDLNCTDRGLDSDVRQAIQAKTDQVLEDVPCLHNQTCALDLHEIMDCKGTDITKVGQRGVGFTISLSAVPITGRTLADERLEEAYEVIQNAVVAGNFTVFIRDINYVILNNMTSVANVVQCSPGQKKVNKACVQCGAGTFQRSSECRPCVEGTFQDRPGQTSCVRCPEGFTTRGELANAKEHCSVKLPVVSYYVETVIAVTFAICAAICISVLLLRYIIRSRYTGSHTLPQS